jgi:Fe-S oxidoreductase
VIKSVVGVAQQREFPKFAAKNFRDQFNRTAQSDAPGSQQVLLWPDTWNNYFHPRALTSAAKVLAAAGNAVQIPQRHVCCGRPLYDFGFLDSARRYLRRILDEFEPQINAGIPVVMLEPSCASVFRDELVNFFPKDERAVRLSTQTIMLSEMLGRTTTDWQPAQMPDRRIVVHGHCHQKALMTMKDEMRLLRATGARVEMLDSGCCGMAGPFGFEADKFAISQTLAERVLLPAVRAAGERDILVSNGFSCREQISQNTDRRAVHLAEVLAGDC